MGTLMGHIIPGTFFIGLSLWWFYSILHRYYSCRITRPEGTYRNSATFPVASLPRVHVEGIIKVVGAVIGISGEVGTGFDGNGHWIQWGNTQHISMFFFFGCSGVVDILYFYKYNLPPNLDYATATLAFLLEGFLFANHLHGRTPLDVMVHTYLYYLIMSGAICVALEGLYRTSVIMALSRAYVVFIQGMWMYQIGFILYPPPGMEKWDENSHTQMMIVTVMFTWYFAGALIVVSMFMIGVWLSLRRTGTDTPYRRTHSRYQKVNSSENQNPSFANFTESSGEEL